MSNSNMLPKATATGDPLVSMQRYSVKKILNASNHGWVGPQLWLILVEIHLRPLVSGASWEQPI